jgi:hypothetical protein
MAKAANPTVSQQNKTKQDGKLTKQRYFAALTLVAAVIPIPFLTALVTIIVYLSLSPFPDPNTFPMVVKQVFQVFEWIGTGNTVLLLGLITTFIVWLLIALPCRRYATAEGGRPADYETLKREVDVLKEQIKLVKENDQAKHTTGTRAAPRAWQKVVKQNITKEQEKALEVKKAWDIVTSEIDADLDSIDKRLNSQGLHWLSTGYVSMWDRVNKADEAMIDVLPRARVIESAKLDEMRLDNSGAPESENLKKLLEKAIETLISLETTGTASLGTKGPKPSSEQNRESNLEQSMAQAMIVLLEDGIDSSNHPASTKKPLYKRILYSIKGNSRPDPHQRDKVNKLQQNLAQAMLALLKQAALPPNPSPPQSEQEARADIRKVKAALHDFTNKRWDGLVRARNVLVVTAFLTSVFTYILVAIAILAPVTPIQIEQAIVFYILGAIVGLYKRLYDEKNTDNAVDDYGLTMTRLIVTPLLSGLAALVGVFLVTILSFSITSHNISPSTAQVMIGDIYDFTKNPQNLVFAAIFGYVPNLVLSILQSKSEDIKGQLKSVSPTDNSETVSKGKEGNGSSKGNGIGSTAKVEKG